MYFTWARKSLLFSGVLPECEMLHAGAGSGGGVGCQVEKDAEYLTRPEWPVGQADHQVAVQPMLLNGPTRRWPE